MNNFIFSIKPKHANNIYKKLKLWEFRTRLPKDLHAGDRIWLYETSPVKQITGYFMVNNVFNAASPSHNVFAMFWNHVKSGAEGTSFEDLKEYFLGKGPKAVRIKDVYKLSNPIPTDQVGWKRPPQNFCKPPEEFPVSFENVMHYVELPF